VKRWRVLSSKSVLPSLEIIILLCLYAYTNSFATICVRYAPLLPIIPLRTPSHVYEVSNVKSISSATANVESQSLMLAFGGPDVFFTRLAPSKGFDLLPDDFNRGLLTIVVLGMAFVLVSLEGMNKKKMGASAWS
jgi:hypothetical protein